MLLVYPVTKIKVLKVQKGFKNKHYKTLQKLHLYLNRRKDKRMILGTKTYLEPCQKSMIPFTIFVSVINQKGESQNR